MSQEHLGGVYDSMAEDFAEHAEDSAYNALYDRPAVLALLGDVTGLEVLDAGCGPGLYLAELLERGAVASGFDASAPMVDLARKRVAGRADVLQARLGDELPYVDGAFDRVVCALAIHYVDDRRAALAELYRVLTPGGVLVLSTQHPMADWLDKGGSYFDVAIEPTPGCAGAVGRARSATGASR